MTLWIRTGRLFVAVLCAVLATSGVARAQGLGHSQGPDLGVVSIGQVEMQLGATGGTGPYTWSHIAGTLPPGLAVRADMPDYFPPTASAGLIGVATAPGDYIFTLRVSAGSTADQVYTLRVTALVSKENQLPDAFVGVPYPHTLTALGVTGGATWAPVGNVVPGLSLDAAGVISGAPTTAGSSNLGFSLTDNTGTVFKSVSLDVYTVHITSPGVLPNATQNVAYSTTILVEGGTAPYSFSANGLPNGLSMSPTGGISGTTNNGAGKYSVNVTATATVGGSYTKTMSIVVVGGSPLLPGISPYGNSFSACTIGVPCSLGVNVSSGGTAPFEWSAEGLPSGMSIRTGDEVTRSWITPGDAELWGTPTETGTFSVQLTVTDDTDATATNTFPLQVSPLLQTNGLLNATLGTFYSQALRVIGGSSPYTSAHTGSELPAGLALNGTLTLTGTPIESGSFSPVFTYTDSASGTLAFTNYFNVNGAGSGGISINMGSDLGSTTTGSPFSRTLFACCAGSIAWSHIGGSLPPGVSLTSGGVLTGTPASSGQYTFLIRAEDGANAANHAARQFTLNATTININGNSTLASANAGTFYTNTFAATGGTNPLTWTVAPFSVLPAGLSLAPSTGILSGTLSPTATGQFFFSVRVADAGSPSQTASQQFSLSIYPFGTVPPVFQSQSPNFGTFSIGQLETSLSATGGDGTYTWSIVGGSLPPGLAVRTDKPNFFPSSASAGLIGVATTPGLYTFTLRVSSGTVHADQVSTLRVTALTAKESQLPEAFVGVPYWYALSALGNAGVATWAASVNQPLPAWLTLSASGVLSGTPTTAGFPNASFSITDGTDTVFKSVSFTVYAVRITTPGVLPNATQNIFYSTTILAAGGTGGITFSANGLPNPLSINSSSGVISGTLNSNSSIGKVSVNVTATASGGGSYTKTMSIDVVGAAAALPSITPSGSFIYDCTVGVSCNRTIQVQNGGSAPFTWSEPIGLPPGMSLRSGSGITSSFVTPGDAQLWGTPTATGAYTVQLTVTDSLGATATNTFPMNVSPLMQTTFLQNGTIDTSYSQTLRVLGGTGGPYTAVQTGGQLAAGLSVNTLLVLSGFPAESGNFNPAFTYSDSATGVLRVDSSLFINGAGGSGFSINTSSNLGTRATGSSNPISFSACCANPITWSLFSGSLPPGLTLSSGGSLNGTSSTAGTYTFLLKATGTPATNYAARLFTLNVTPLSISPSSPLPFGNVASVYTQTLTATGAPGAVTWTLNAGSYLPPGLGLASNGVLSGTPTASGQYTFTITATDAAANFRSNTFRVSMYPVGSAPPVAISTNPNFGTFSIGQLETPLTATGGTGTYTWSLFSGTLPPGLAVRTDKPQFFPSSASAGLIGVATTPGSYSFTLRVSSGAATADLVSTLTVTALVPRENQLPDAFVGLGYSYALSGAGNAGPMTWTASGLPPGLSLSGGGVVSGTPTTANFSNVNFNLTDGTHTVSKSVSLDIYAVRITSPGVLPNVTEDIPYSTTIEAAGGSGGHTFSAYGLPNGLSLDPVSGVISGTVDSGNSSLGNAWIEVTATADAGGSYTKAMSIDVVGAAPAPMSVDPSGSNIYDCTLGVPCTRTISVRDGGTAPFTWTATGLPPGMSIRFGSGTTLSWVTPGDAELWGTATATGGYDVELTVTDALAATVTATFPMTVSPLLQTNYLADGTIDQSYSQTMRVIGGTGPYTVVQTDGQLPAGITLNGATLIVSGTPVESGNGFNPVFTYTDAASRTLQFDNYLYINDAGDGSVSIDRHPFDLDLLTGSLYGNQFLACCAGSIIWSKIAGNLPPGLTLSSGGLLSGISSTSGTYTFLLKARDAATPANFAARYFTLNVTPPGITLSATTVAAGGTVTATITNGPGNALDWVGLYPTGASSAIANRIAYRFLNGLTTAPAMGQSGGLVTFTLPSAPGTYNVRFFLNNGLTVLATSAPIEVVGSSIALNATTGVGGQTVTATIANGPGNALDWVGLYPTGATSAVANRIAYRFLNGLTTAPASGQSGGLVTFTLPSVPGSYNVRFFLNNGLTVLVTSAPIEVVGSSIALSATTGVGGQTVTATIANGPGNALDWVGLYPTGATSAVANRIAYRFLNGLTTAPASGQSGGLVTFTLPSAPGTYNVRFFLNNGLTVLATSAPIEVVGSSIALSATTGVGGQTVTATIANGPGNALDWVGLYPTGATSAVANRIAYRFLNGLTTAPASGQSGGLVTFTLPSVPGSYNVRFFLNNGLTVLATSAPIEVVGSSISLSATIVAPGGTVTATIANGPANALDWVGLYPAASTSALANRVAYRFLNGLTTAPSSGLPGGAVTFTLPIAPGQYNVRFFLNNSLTVLATSATITVP